MGRRPSDLENEDSIVIQEVVDVREELVVVTDADVLSHLERDDLGVVSGLDRDVTVVEVEDTGLARVDAVLLETVVTEASLGLGEGDTGDITSVVDSGERGEGSPTAANVENAVFLLQVKLGADEVELVVLEFLEGLGLVGVGNDTGGVDHLRAKEPLVEVVSSVVVVLNLSLVLLGSVHKNIGDEVEEDVVEKRPGELHGTPVPAVLEELVEGHLGFDLGGKVGIVEGLVRDLLVTVVLLAELRVLDVHVEFEGLAGKLNLFVDTRAVGGHDSPVGDGDGSTKEGAEEQVAEPAEPLRVDKGNQTEHDGRGDKDETRKVEVVGRIRCPQQGEEH